MNFPVSANDRLETPNTGQSAHVMRRKETPRNGGSMNQVESTTYGPRNHHEVVDDDNYVGDSTQVSSRPALPPAAFSSPSLLDFVRMQQHAQQILDGRYESQSLVSGYDEAMYHKAVVARFKSGILSHERETERFHETQRKRKKADEDDEASFAISSEALPPAGTKLTPSVFDELLSNKDSDYISFEQMKLLAPRPIVEFAEMSLRQRKQAALATTMIPGQATGVDYPSGLSTTAKKVCSQANRMCEQHLGIIARIVGALANSLIAEYGPTHEFAAQSLDALDVTLNLMREVQLEAATKAGMKASVTDALKRHDKVGRTPLISQVTRVFSKQRTQDSIFFRSRERQPGSGNGGRGARGGSRNRGRSHRTPGRGRGRGSPPQQPTQPQPSTKPSTNPPPPRTAPRGSMTPRGRGRGRS